MQINLYLAQTLRQATKEVIKNVEVSQNLDLRNFIVVPDRFSLQAEKLLFQELGISSTFNIDVISISKLASLVLKLSGNQFKTQSNLEGMLLVYKILIEHQAEFESLKDANLSIDLAKEIFLTISQLKSCEISADKFLKSANELANQKLIDIAKIYEFYECIEREKIDAADLITLFAQQIEESELIKNSNFYFAEFDSFTSQVKTIIELLVKSSRSVSIATCSTTGENEYIYEKDVLQKVAQICENLKIKPNIIICEKNQNEFQKHIADNLFAFKQTQKNIPYGVAILNNSNITSEIEQVANIIKFEILQNGYNFSDFNIFVPSLESYQKQIDEIFSSEDIACYIDATKTLLDLAPIKFILKVFDFLKDENILNFLALVSDNFSQINNKEVELLNKNIFEKGFKVNDALNLEINNIGIFNKKIKKIKEQYEKIKVFSEFIELLVEILNIFELNNQIENLTEKFKDDGDLNNEKIYVQFENKFNQAIEQLKKMNLDCDLSVESMQQIATEMFSSIMISNLPLSINSVFVGQNNVSFFEERKIGIFVGCGDNVPLSQKDSGLILDSDINRFETIKIEPSVEMINRRNKFKLFNDACLSSEKVYLSMLSCNAMPEFVRSFKNMWLVQNSPVPVSDEFYINADNKIFMQDLIFKSLLNSKRNEILKAVKNEKSLRKISCEEISNAKDVLYPKHSTSISKIQQFFNCPFMHFACYGLNLQPNLLAQVMPQDIGNLFHAFAENFLKVDVAKLQDKEFLLQVNRSFAFAKNSNERLAMLCKLEENRPYFSYLNKQASHFAHILIKQIECCAYKPCEFENKFVVNLGEINGDKFVVNGRIDRIDKSNDSVRVIDYKTGDDQVSLAKFYEGRQLQLPIYILSLEKSNKVDGAFYFPVFGSLTNKDNKLNGYFEDETSVIKKLDTTLSPEKLKSDVVNLSLQKSSTAENFKVYARNGVLEKGHLKKLTFYAKKLVESGIEESLKGNIKALPNETKICEYCPYYSLCMFNIEFGEFRESAGTIKEKDIVEIVEKF